MTVQGYDIYLAAGLADDGMYKDASWGSAIGQTVNNASDAVRAGYARLRSAAAGARSGWASPPAPPTPAPRRPIVPTRTNGSRARQAAASNGGTAPTNPPANTAPTNPPANTAPNSTSPNTPDGDAPQPPGWWSTHSQAGRDAFKANPDVGVRQTYTDAGGGMRGLARASGVFAERNPYLYRTAQGAAVGVPLAGGAYAYSQYQANKPWYEKILD